MATPDGRVVMCGGVRTELVKGGRVKPKGTFHIFACFKWEIGCFQLEAINSTDCWYWVHGTNVVRRLEFYSKLPYKVF